MVSPNGPGNDTEEHVEYIIDGSGLNGRFVPGSDDIRKEIKVTIGDMISQHTKVGHDNGFGPSHGNDFPLKPGSNEFSFRNQDGSPAALDNTARGGEPFFPVQQGGDYSSLSSISYQFETLGEVLEKGKAPNFLKDIRGRPIDNQGNIVTQEPTEKIPKMVQTVLNNNRFSSLENRTFNSDGLMTKTDPGLEKPFASAQKTFGVFDESAKGIIFDELRKVGLSLMLKAAEGPLAEGVDPTKGGDIALIPGVPQLGVGSVVNRGSLRAKDAYGAPDLGNGLDNDQLDPSFTFGSTYHFLEPFENDVIASRALAASLALALAIAIKPIQGILSGIVGVPASLENLKKKELSSLSRITDISLTSMKHPLGYKLGTSRKRDKTTPSFIPTVEQMGLYLPTSTLSNNPNGDLNGYFAVVERGIHVLFDPIAVGMTPGYYVTLTRDIVKETVIIGADIGGKVKSTSQSISVSQVANDVFGSIKKILSSKLIKFTNVLAQIGDISYKINPKLGEPTKIPGHGLGLDPEFQNSLIDSQLNNETSINKLAENSATNKSAKSRLSDGSLSWGTSKSKSMYLLPSNALNDQVDSFGIVESKYDAVKESNPNNELFPNPKDPNIKTISSNEVKKIEKDLDSEYVPFYFHDLRTNEIISFHAFLDNLSDDYTVNYNSSNAYGRIDKVHTYQSTDRKISFSFYVVSTNEDDFDQMWWKINKLVTLVYPQWSAGDVIYQTNSANSEVQAASDKFIQPFSQIPTSTPIIRLRIGDVIKSNYSNPSIKRIFGKGTNSFQQNEEVFFSSEENSIIKSFESIGGKGLAGVLNSLSFDWISNTVWETTRDGSIAPKILKVSTNFDCIHDISPGIDAEGFNRAPLYSVGRLVNNVFNDFQDTQFKTRYDLYKKFGGR